MPARGIFAASVTCCRDSAGSNSRPGDQIEVALSGLGGDLQQRAIRRLVGAVDQRPQPQPAVGPERGVDVRLLRGHQRRPALAGEQRGVAALDRQHRPQERAIARVPGDPGAEDVFPDHHAAAVHPGRVQFAGVVVSPAADLVLHVAAFEPLVPQHAGHLAVARNAAPTRRGDRRFVPAAARLRLRGSRRAARRRAWRGTRLRPGSWCRGRCRPRRAPGPSRPAVHVGLVLAPRAAVPGIVVDVDLHAALLAGMDHIAHARPGRRACRGRNRTGCAGPRRCADRRARARGCRNRRTPGLPRRERRPPCSGRSWGRRTSRRTS